MKLKLADWLFQVDIEANRSHSEANAFDHCQCGYCRNFYEAVDEAYPRLRFFLSEFGIRIDGPSELLPFKPTLILACYQVRGEILRWGRAEIFVNGISITPEAGGDGTFLLWVGEMELPWLQQERPEDVVSPANLPEFMDRMLEVWQLHHGSEIVFS